MAQIILGDNQFFGINHMSEEKARAQAMKFKDTAAIVATIDAAFECGVRRFMFTTHDLVRELCDHFRAHPDKYQGLELLPGMPYAHKYANAVAEKGVVQTLMDATAGNKWSMVATGGMALLKQDLARLVRILVDAEMKMFEGLNTPVIFLQNIVTDLMLGMGESDAFGHFADHVRSRYGADPGFVTMNLPRLVEHLRRIGIERPVVCSSINPIGYLMNPSLEACESTLRTGGVRSIAMSILAAGAVRPKAAVDYLRRLPPMEGVLFGASSRENIQQMVSLIRAAEL